MKKQIVAVLLLWLGLVGAASGTPMRKKPAERLTRSAGLASPWDSPRAPKGRLKQALPV